MIGTEALIALAILISHQGALDTTSLEAQLNANQKAQVEAYVEEEKAIPGSLEALLKDTHEKIQRGDLPYMAKEGQPTNGCM